MSDLPERVDPRQLRASDADRERVAEVLRTSAAEGRLDLGELDDRLRAVYASRTYAELESTWRTCRSRRGAGRPRRGPPRPGEAAEKGLAGRGDERVQPAGRLGPAAAVLLPRVLGRRHDRPARRRFLFGDLKIRAFALMGGVEVIVPDDAEVDVTGIGLMGGFDHGGAAAGRPGAPRIVVTGFALWGGVTVRHKARRPKNTSKDMHKATEAFTTPARAASGAPRRSAPSGTCRRPAPRRATVSARAR